MSLCAELFEGSPHQVTLSGSNTDRSRNYNGPCRWSEIWVIGKFTGRLPRMRRARPDRCTSLGLVRGSPRRWSMPRSRAESRPSCWRRRGPAGGGRPARPGQRWGPPPPPAARREARHLAPRQRYCRRGHPASRRARQRELAPQPLLPAPAGRRARTAPPARAARGTDELAVLPSSRPKVRPTTWRSARRWPVYSAL